MMAIVLIIFIGSGMIGVAVSGDKPQGAPFEALWEAIENIGDSHWSLCTNNPNSICTPDAVGIGTDYSDKKLKVAGDAMFINPDNETYFFIEQGRENNEGTDGKRIGAYDEPGAWKTLEVDGGPLLLNTRSNKNVTIGGYIQLALSAGQPPDSDCDEPSELGRMKVDNDAGSLYICVDSGWVSK